MNATKWLTAIVACVPTMAACEVESGQCVRGSVAPTGTPVSSVGETPPAESAAPFVAAAAVSAVSSAPAVPASAAPAASAAAPAASAAPEAAPAAPATPQLRTVEGTVSATPPRAAANAVVYLVDAPLEPKRGMHATVDQRAMTFIPYTSAIAVGGSVTFLNSDPFPHNVFSPAGEKFNIGMMNQNQSRTVTFHQTGDHALLCNVHPGMIGHVFVAPTSYFAVTDVHGKYSMKDVPEGTYKIAIWAGKYVADEQTVKLQGADATVDFALHK